MNEIGISTISLERIEQAIRLRYSPFPELTMELLSRQLNQFRVGELRPASRTFEIMLERDGELLAPALKRFEAMAGLDWEIMTADESPEADRHAEALRYFYNHCQTTSVLDADEIGDVSLLIKQVATAIAMRYSVHEMLLRVDNAAAREVTAEFRHCPVWFFEAHKGRLGFLRQEFDFYGEPLLPGEWLAAVGYGLMRPCAIAYAVKHFPLRDWMLFCSRFGIPGIHGETPAAKGSQEWTDFCAAVAEYASNWITVTGQGPKINLIEAKTGGQLPFKELVDSSNQLYSKLFRGSDMATNSVEKPNVGASIQKNEGQILTQQDAPWITAIFNARIDRPVLRYLFNAEPKAWFKLLPPKEDTTDRDLKTAEFMVNHKAPIAVQTARDRFSWPKPEAGQPVLEAAAPEMSNLKSQISNSSLANARDDWRQAALAQAMGVVTEWLTPLQALFNELETVLQTPGKNDQELLAWVEKAAAAFPDKFADMDLEFLARRFESALGAATLAGMKEAQA